MNRIQRTKRRQRIGLGSVTLILLVLLIHYHNGRNQVPPRPIANVVVDTVTQRDVPVYLSGLGSVTPTATVTLKTQINGQLLKVLFREGQLVKAGSLLAEIDPRPYEAQLTQYEGQLARDRALLTNAQLDLKRYKLLWSQDSVSKQVLDTQAALVQQYEGVVKLDQGLIQNTQLNLNYTRIVSPVNGRIGLRLVDPGNYVQVSDLNGLAVITTLDPISVIFSLPEDDVPQVLQQLDANNKLAVIAYDRNENKRLATGELLTIDNQIDPTTGTVKLKALFDNHDNRLFPSQFVNVKLLVTTLHNAVVVPTAAIQHGVQDANFVYRLNTNQTVSAHAVTTSVSHAGYTVINKGLEPGQIVVIDGADKLNDGSKVKTSKPVQQAAQQQRPRI